MNTAEYPRRSIEHGSISQKEYLDQLNIPNNILGPRVDSSVAGRWMEFSFPRCMRKGYIGDQTKEGLVMSLVCLGLSRNAMYHGGIEEASGVILKRLFHVVFTVISRTFGGLSSSSSYQRLWEQILQISRLRFGADATEHPS